MTKSAYVIFQLPGESAEGYAQFVIKYGTNKEANLTLFGIPIVPEGEHEEMKPVLYELMEALEAWRKENGPIHTVDY